MGINWIEKGNSRSTARADVSSDSTSPGTETIRNAS